MPAEKLTIVNLSHLAWEKKLFQRPQQLMSRFAAMGDDAFYFALIGLRRYMEMGIEERVISSGTLTAQNLPFMPLAKRLTPSRAATMAILRAKASAPLKNAPAGRRVLWLQNPAYVELIDKLPHDLVVYDVMDPFSAFRTSDPRVAEREDRVLRKADVVFTGGRSLHTQVENRHPNVHCFPSGIDFGHFARAAQSGNIPRDIASLEKPVLGYFGAVDERIDWKLIESICRERRHWSIVFLGPLVLIPEIPIKEPNFHWLGAKSYDQLPDYLRAFDVCLIPWLVNDLTRFMSPTKTPEYLAAGKPVVSTPIPDVATDYANEVGIADTPEAYLQACTTVLMRGTGPACKPPQSRSWDETAAEMRALIVDKLSRK
ncbi:glycosyltransferase [Candidatus Sumerlaeota bacterium]|nr:glycosyltransferase [Candidatus Sumerlaeota bacterium]